MQFLSLIFALMLVVTIVAVYALEVSFLFRFIFNKLRNQQADFGLLNKWAPLLHTLALVGIACFSYAYFIEPYRIEVRAVDILTEKLKKANLRIVQISDLHCDTKMRNENRLVDIINPLKPDIIVFTGDAVNTPGALPLFKDIMRKLKASIGKYAVLGNYDV